MKSPKRALLARRLSRVVGYVWAAPCTGVGLMVGTLGLLTGGSAQVIDGVIEFHGGAVTALLRRVPVSGGAAAMTIGHVVLGQDQAFLHETRRHEHVHVRQYERWGVFFFLAYFAVMPWLVWQGLDPYRDNPFEVEAFRVSESAARDEMTGRTTSDDA